MIQNPTRNTTDSIRCTGVALRPLATLMATDGGTAWTICGHFVVGAGSAANAMLVQFHDGTTRVVTIALATNTGVLAAYVRNAAGTQNAKSVTFTAPVLGSVVTFAVVWNGDGSTWSIRASCNGETLADTTGSTAQPFSAVAGVSLFDPVDTAINGNGAEGHLQVQVLNVALDATQFAAAVAYAGAGAFLDLHRSAVRWACGHHLQSVSPAALPGALPTAADIAVLHDSDNDGSLSDEDWTAIPASGVAVAGTGLRYSRPTEASAQLRLRTQAEIGVGAYTVPTAAVAGINNGLARLAAGTVPARTRIAIVSNSRGNLQQLDAEDPPTNGDGWQVNYAAGLAKHFVSNWTIGSGNYQSRLSGANGFLLDYVSTTSSGATYHDGAGNTPWDDWCRFGYNSGAGTSSTDATGPGQFCRLMNTSGASNVRFPFRAMGLVLATDPVTVRALVLRNPNAPAGVVAVQHYDGTTFTTQATLSLNTEVGSTTVVSYTGGSTTIVLTGDHRAAILAGDMLTIEVSAGAWAPAMVASVSQTLSGGNTVVTLEVACNHKTTSTGRTIPTAGNAVRYGPWEWAWATVTFTGSEPTKELRLLMPGGADTTAMVPIYAVEAWAHERKGIVPMPMGWGGHGYALQLGGSWGAYRTVSARTGQSPVSALLAILQIDTMIVTAAEQSSSASNTQLFIDEFQRGYPGSWRRRLVLATGPAMPATTSPTQMGFSDQTAQWAEWQAANAPTLGVPWLNGYAACGNAIEYWHGSAHNNAHISAEGNRLAAAAWMAQAAGAVGAGASAGSPRGRSRRRRAVALHSAR